MKSKEVRRQLIMVRRELDRMVAGRLHVAFDDAERSRYRQLMDYERHLLGVLGPIRPERDSPRPGRFRYFLRRPKRYCHRGSF